MTSTQSILNTINPKKNYKKIFLVWGIISVVVAILIALIYWWNTREPSISYQTQKAFIGDISSTISANGTLSPTNEISIGSVISGIVLEVLVDVNDKVKKGQILAKIDSESIEQDLYRYQAQLGSAKAQLKSAQVTLQEKQWQYKQYRNLYQKTKGKTPSILELETAKTAYNEALSNVEIRKASIKEIETSIRSTQVDLRNSKITSPIDGVVLQRSIEVGQSVAASFQAPEFFIIAESLEEMELNASISEADIGKVKVGQSVEFSVDSYPAKTFKAKVDRVNYGASNTSSSTASSSTTTTSSGIVSYEARIYVSNKDLLLRPGMSATADIEVASAKNALLVPSSALYFTPKIQEVAPKKSPFNPFVQMRPKHQRQVAANNERKTIGSVWILENGTPKKIEVETGISDGQSTQILGDSIKPDMMVIVGQKQGK